jgi:predicted nucleic acid-binding protein
VVTVAELTVGVLLASDADRPRRLATLSAVESTWNPLPIDGAVARGFARLVAAICGKGQRVPLLDALVAATALVEGIPVVTRDRDYEAIPDRRHARTSTAR